MQKRNVFAVTMGLVVVVIATCYFAYGLNAKSAARKQVSDALLKDAAYTETVLKAEADASNITFQELFDLCDKSLSLKTDLVIELRTGLPGIDPPLRDKLISYVNAESSVIRSKRAYYHKKLDFDEKDRAQTEVSRRAANASALSDYYLKRRDLDDALRWANEALEMHRGNLRTSQSLSQSATEVGRALEEYWANYGGALAVESDVRKLCGPAGIAVGTPFHLHQKSAEDAVKTTRELVAKFKGPS